MSLDRVTEMLRSLDREVRSFVDLARTCPKQRIDTFTSAMIADILDQAAVGAYEEITLEDPMLEAELHDLATKVRGGSVTPQLKRTGDRTIDLQLGPNVLEIQERL